MISNSEKQQEKHFQPLKSKRRKESQTFEVSSILVGVGGGSAAGKTTLCEGIKQEMQFDSSFDICIIALDSFYKVVDKSKVDIKQYNFDHPDSLDFDLAYKVLQQLLKGKATDIPIYSFITHSRLDESTRVQPTQVIFFEGILALYDQRINDLMQFKFFIHCDDDIRLCRRILRDVKERGRAVDNILYQYNTFVKRAYEDYIRPTINYADIIVPGSRSNKVAVAWIVHHLKNLCKQSGVLKVSQNKLFFFGDLLYTFDDMFEGAPQQDYSILQHQSIPHRKFICPTSESRKQEMNSRILFLNSNYPFDYKQLYIGIKCLLKQCLNMLLHSLKYTEIPIGNVQVINLNKISVQQTISEQSISELIITKDYIVIVFPFLLLDQEQEYLETIKKAIKQYHQNVVVHQTVDPIVTLFINAFLVGRLSNFRQILQNCLNDLTSDQLWGGALQQFFFFESDKFYQKSVRYIQKRQQITQ